MYPLCFSTYAFICHCKVSWLCSLLSSGLNITSHILFSFGLLDIIFVDYVDCGKFFLSSSTMGNHFSVHLILCWFSYCLQIFSLRNQLLFLRFFFFINDLYFVLFQLLIHFLGLVYLILKLWYDVEIFSDFVYLVFCVLISVWVGLFLVWENISSMTLLKISSRHWPRIFLPHLFQKFVGFGFHGVPYFLYAPFLFFITLIFKIFLFHLDPLLYFESIYFVFCLILLLMLFFKFSKWVIATFSLIHLQVMVFFFLLN